MAKRLLQVHAVCVYVLLYVPILVVVVLAFNGGRRVLLWEGFSTRWFGAALRDEDIRSALQNSLVIATTIKRSCIEPRVPAPVRIAREVYEPAHSFPSHRLATVER